VTEDCSEAQCPGEAAFEIGSWTTCSETCGITGTQTRTVLCVYENGVYGDLTDCGDEVPLTTQSCSVISDDCGTWATGSWTNCPVTCGDGIVTRTVTCDVDECVGSEPVTSLECTGLLACPTYAWSVEDWTDCSVTCGTGIITRTVECLQDATIAIEDTEFCDGTAPISVDVCTGATLLCPNVYIWHLSSWSTCDATCGAGNQTRTVACYNSEDSSIVDDSLCLAVGDATESPDSSKCCFVADCVAWNTGDWSACSSNIMTRTVTCLGIDDGMEYATTVCVDSGAGAMPCTSESC